MKKSILLVLSSFAVFFHLSSHIYIDDVMNEAEQQKTGVYDLSHNQKQELEKWLNDNFILKDKNLEPSEEVVSNLTFDMVLGGGKYVQLSDQSLWEIAPQDIAKTSVWLLPFPIVIKEGQDPNYPTILENQNTGESVNAKKAPVNLAPPSINESTLPAPSTP